MIVEYWLASYLGRAWLWLHKGLRLKLGALPGLCALVAHGNSLEAGQLFASIGGTDGTRQEPAWYFNKVTEPKKAKNRVHIDLVNPDPSAIDELVRLGAAVAGNHKVPGHPWTVLRDPEGNEFCIAAKSFTGWD